MNAEAFYNGKQQCILRRNNAPWNFTDRCSGIFLVIFLSSHLLNAMAALLAVTMHPSTNKNRIR
jgi:hypothetical protein